MVGSCLELATEHAPTSRYYRFLFDRVCDAIRSELSRSWFSATGRRRELEAGHYIGAHRRRLAGSANHGWLVFHAQSDYFLSAITGLLLPALAFSCVARYHQRARHCVAAE